MAVAFLSTGKGPSATAGKDMQLSAKDISALLPPDGGEGLRIARPPSVISSRLTETVAQMVREESPLEQPYYSIAQFTQKIELYSGSVATVYQAIEIKTGGRVVIKAYHKEKMQPKHHHKLQREIDAMVALNGSFVVELHSTFSDSANIYLVMEYCEGGDLFKTMMKHGGRLDEHYVCVEIILPLLRILEKMHAACIMHRDIKPENIFLTRRGRLRLGDFGLAINWTQELPFSRSGTLDYMAPEVLQNPATQLQESATVDMDTLSAKNIKPFTCAVDVWAAGVLAYELVCGRPPFEVEDEVKTVTKILYCNAIKFPTPTANSFTPAWTDFVRCALIKDPARRPDAKALLQHPWIQSNLQRAIACAPTPQHRQCKEDLLRPLSLTPRPMRLPAVRPSPLNLASAPSTPPAPLAVTMPSTPQPRKAGPEASQHVVQYLHSHFSSMSCKEEQPGGPGAAQSARKDAERPSTAAAYGARAPEQQPPPSPLPSSQQRLQAATPYNASPYNPSYQASPLSNRTALSYTPTKNHASSILGQPPSSTGHRTAFASSAQAAYQQQQQQAAAAMAMPQQQVREQMHMQAQPPGRPGTPPSSNLGEVERLMADALAHGAVHVTRVPAALSPKSPDPHGQGHNAVQTPIKGMDLRVPLLRSLFIPASAGEEVVHPSPGPAGPGIKERLKWHLSRQAGP